MMELGRYRKVIPESQARGSGLCYQCCGIDIERLMAHEGYLHQQSLANLSASARTCELCSLFDEELMSCSGWTDEVAHSPSLYCLVLKSDKRLPGIRAVGASETKTHTSKTHRVIAHAFIVERGQLDAGCEEYAKPLPGDISSTFYFTLLTDEGDPATAFGVPTRHQLGESTKSNRSFDTARRWLRECLSHEHSESRSSAVGPGGSGRFARPSRLLEILNSDARAPSLRLVNGDDVTEPYSALSYSWGTSAAPWKTVNSNIQSRMIGFSKNDLPATLRDAIDISEKLGARYIWIDSCCIVQDDEADWLRESGKMGDIYGQALLCISASSSTSSHHGCYNVRSLSNLDRSAELFSISRVLASGIQSHLHIPRIRGSLWESEVMNGPLSRRAWTYQERILSQRTLHYTAVQLFWQCRHGILSEDNIDSGTGPGGEERLSKWREVLWQTERHELRTLAALDDTMLGSGETATTKLERLWYNDVVGNDYSRRKLSYRRDKLIAVAGLAKAVQRKTSSRYVAGIWEPSVLEGLAWQRLGPGGKPAEYEAPTWSWASQESAVNYVNMGGAVVRLCEVKAVYVQTDRSNEFGRVLHGWLDIHGYIFDAIIEPDALKRGYGLRESWQARFLPIEKCTVMMDDDIFESGPAIALLLLHDAYQINFLLLVAGDAPCVYRRSGLATVWDQREVSSGQVEALTTSSRSTLRLV